MPKMMRSRIGATIAVSTTAAPLSRLGAPNRYRELAELVAHFHLLCHKARELKPTTVVRMLGKLDAIRRPERFEQFLIACEADARGRLGFETRPYPQADYLRRARDTAAAVGTEALRAQGLDGKVLGEALVRARAEAIADLRQIDDQTNT